MARHTRKLRPVEIDIHRDPMRLNTPVILDFDELSIALSDEQAQQVAHSLIRALAPHSDRSRRPSSIGAPRRRTPDH